MSINELLKQLDVKLPSDLLTGSGVSPAKSGTSPEPRAGKDYRKDLARSLNTQANDPARSAGTPRPDEKPAVDKSPSSAPVERDNTPEPTQQKADSADPKRASAPVAKSTVNGERPTPADGEVESDPSLAEQTEGERGANEQFTLAIYPALRTGILPGDPIQQASDDLQALELDAAIRNGAAGLAPSGINEMFAQLELPQVDDPTNGAPAESPQFSALLQPPAGMFADAAAMVAGSDPNCGIQIPTGPNESGPVRLAPIDETSENGAAATGSGGAVASATGEPTAEDLLQQLKEELAEAITDYLTPTEEKEDDAEDAKAEKSSDGEETAEQSSLDNQASLDALLAATQSDDQPQPHAIAGVDPNVVRPTSDAPRKTFQPEVNVAEPKIDVTSQTQPLLEPVANAASTGSVATQPGVPVPSQENTLPPAGFLRRPQPKPAVVPSAAAVANRPQQVPAAPVAESQSTIDTGRADQSDAASLIPGLSLFTGGPDNGFSITGNNSASADASAAIPASDALDPKGATKSSPDVVPFAAPTRNAEGKLTTKETEKPIAVNGPDLAEKLATVVRRSSQDQQRLSVRLQPPELGFLQIDVTSRDGLLSVRLEVESRSAHDALQKSLSGLRETLVQQGMLVDRIDVQVNEPQRDSWRQGFDRGNDRDQQQQRDQSERERQRREQPPSQSTDETPRGRRPRRPIGGIDQLDIAV